MQTSVTLDTDTCKNIKANDATTANVGKDRQITYTILPGSETDIIITAEVTDFEMDGISINGIPLSMSIDIDDDKTEEFTDEITELTDAVAELNDGAVQIRDGASELKEGAESLYSGLSQLSSNSESLRNGAYEIFAQLTYTAQSQLNESLSAAGFSPVTLNPENYDATITELLNRLSGGAYSQAQAVSTEEIRSQVEAVVTAQIEESIRSSEKIMGQIDATVEAQYGDTINTYAQNAAALEFAKTMSPDTPEKWLQTAEGQTSVTAFLSSEQGQQAVANARKEVKAQYIEAAVEGKVSAQMQSDEIKLQINSAVEEQLASDEIQQQINDAVNSALETSEDYQGIVTLKTQLDNYQIFYSALVQYTKGVDSAAEGSLELKGGLSQILNGAEQLENGSKELYEGLLKLKDGSAELLDGTITLNNGAVEFNDGIVKLNDGSMSVLNGTATLDGGAFDLFDGIITLKRTVLHILLPVQLKCMTELSNFTTEQ